MARLSALLLLLLLLPTVALAASGIKGRVAWRGDLCAGVRVRAYHSVADIAAEKAVAVSAPTKTDGSYQLELPPGSYYLTARDFDGAPLPGKLFCYFSGAPAQVRNGSFTNVGFNMIRIPVEAPPPQRAVPVSPGRSPIRGKSWSAAISMSTRMARTASRDRATSSSRSRRGRFACACRRAPITFWPASAYKAASSVRSRPATTSAFTTATRYASKPGRPARSNWRRSPNSPFSRLTRRSPFAASAAPLLARTKSRPRASTSLPIAIRP